MNVRLSKEQKIRVLNSEDVYKVMQQILLRENKVRRNQEHFWVVGLDNQNAILFIELISLGGVNRVQVAPPEVFRMAIYKLAVRMILVHNHPSGELQPSDADMDLTDRMIKSGEMLKVEVIEHLIISEKDYLSFTDEGLIDELKESGSYKLVSKEKAGIERLKADLKKENAVKNKSLDIAKRMKEKGYEPKLIKELTGLKDKDIKKL